MGCYAVWLCVLKEHCASLSGTKVSQKSAKHGMDRLTNYTCMVLLVSGCTEGGEPLSKV